MQPTELAPVTIDTAVYCTNCYTLISSGFPAKKLRENLSFFIQHPVPRILCMYVCMYEMHCFCPFGPLFCSGRGSFSRAVGCEARRGSRVYLRRKFGSRPALVASALGVQSRAVWQVITGSVSASPSLARTLETPHF